MEILFEALLDSVKILPFIFIIYLFIEYIEHKNNTHLSHFLMNSKHFGPVFGSVLGCIPQCGFSVIAADLFSRKAITMGTLIAIFVSTSDEAIPIILSKPSNIGLVFKIIIVKFIIAVLSGIVIDLIFLKENTSSCNKKEEHSHFHGNCETCEGGILKSTIIHSLKIFAFIFIVSFMLGFIIDMVGMDRLSSFLMKGTMAQPAISALLGLIPNCAASVVLTQTYLSGAITFGSLLAGLSSGAGVGLIVLFKHNKNMKQNFNILVSVYLIGTIFGILIDIL